MSGDWYYVRSGQWFGPFAFEQFRQLGAAGLLSPDDMVWNEQGDQWTSANAVEGLLDSGPPSVAPNDGLTTPLDEQASPKKTTRPVAFDDRTAWCWGVFLVAADISILHLCVCVWFGLDYSRLLWFPTMTLAVVIAGLAFAVASVCSVVCFATDTAEMG